jgi:leucyl aminopeptidase (aminopeptidase T)
LLEALYEAGLDAGAQEAEMGLRAYEAFVLGAGHPETGNGNPSGLHWDMVCDLRDGGEVRADGEVIARDGRFVRAGWPALP